MAISDDSADGLGLGRLKKEGVLMGLPGDGRAQAARAFGHYISVRKNCEGGALPRVQMY